ncbi:hypothetical protein F7725_003680 [Dissostichus mawsoni]|uniref:Dehydrogenase/reductase SDR family member 7B n=1 Tax=Dissostichus mawsoni TaxID=36200 RepID=A0A7J5YAV6_DISMA|nr:hypothetical protein F7725_003680 [Dissostichus mawsoni]
MSFSHGAHHGRRVFQMVLASAGLLLLYRILVRLRPALLCRTLWWSSPGAALDWGKSVPGCFTQQVPVWCCVDEMQAACSSVTFDLADTDTVDRAAEEILKYYGHVDVLINNAGISYRGNILDTNLSVQRDVMETNYFGPIALTQALLPSMVQRRSGHIVVISSVQGKMAIPYRSAYAASKHATQAYFDCLRAEIERYGIPVTVISPGYIRTSLSLNAVTGDGSNVGRDPLDVARAVLRAVRQRSKDVVLAGPLPSLALYLRTLWPALFFKLMSSRARKEQKPKEE